MSDDTPPDSRIDTEQIVDALTSSTAVTVYLAVLLLALGLLVYIGGRFYLGIPTVLLVLYVLSFVAGLAFIPLGAWTIFPSLGSFIPEGLANLTFIVSMLGVRRGIWEQQETDEYEIKRGSKELKPLSYWSRWALAPFGITFEATEQAFEADAIDDERRAGLENLEFGTDGTATTELERGDRTWFVTKADLKHDILVPVGQKLAELRNASGTDLSREAYAAALGEHGGDTSGASNRLRLIGVLVFVVLGMGLGWVVHF